MTVRLLIAGDSYTLAESRDDGARLIALLPRGAEALLGSAHPVDEARLEAGIEIAEDWLMPHTARLRGEVLEVLDASHRLKAGLRDVLSVTTNEWRVEDIERFFLTLVEMTTGRTPAPVLQSRSAFIADLLLLRELAHHGRLNRITLS